jgi:hypothetical protein
MPDLASLPEAIRSALEEPALHPGARQVDIDAAAKAHGVQFPADYAAFLRDSNGAEFHLGDTYVVLYALEDLAAENEPDEEFDPRGLPLPANPRFPSWLFVFGSNGGSEKFAFDKRETPHQIVVVPHFEPDDDEALPQGTTLHGFLARVLAGEAFDG